MLNRRKFLGALAGLTAVTALAGAGIRLPKRVDEDALPDLSEYFTKAPSWAPIGWSPTWEGDFDASIWSNVRVTPYISEESLEAIIRAMKEAAPGSYTIRPTKIIVHPSDYARAERLIRGQGPGWFERLWAHLVMI